MSNIEVLAAVLSCSELMKRKFFLKTQIFVKQALYRSENKRVKINHLYIKYERVLKKLKAIVYFSLVSLVSI